MTTLGRTYLTYKASKRAKEEMVLRVQQEDIYEEKIANLKKESTVLKAKLMIKDT